MCLYTSSHLSHTHNNKSHLVWFDKGSGLVYIARIEPICNNRYVDEPNNAPGKSLTVHRLCRRDRFCPTAGSPSMSCYGQKLWVVSSVALLPCDTTLTQLNQLMSTVTQTLNVICWCGCGCWTAGRTEPRTHSLPLGENDGDSVHTNLFHPCEALGQSWTSHC